MRKNSLSSSSGLPVFAFVLSSVMGNFGAAQVGVQGNASISLADAGVICSGQGRAVDVFVDITGLAGSNGDAGLNAFVLCFDLNRSNVFAYAQKGNAPQMNWQFTFTDRILVNTSDHVCIVGSTDDSNAPNGEYYVGRLILVGEAGQVSFSLDTYKSSLGSKAINGSLPGLISIEPLPVFIVEIPQNSALVLAEALEQWRQRVPQYDLVEPWGAVDVMDLVQLINCGG